MDNKPEIQNKQSEVAFFEALLKNAKQELESLEAANQKEEEQALLQENGIYVPLGTAIVRRNLWLKGEGDFAEIGDSDWYTVGELLGDPDKRANSKVVLLRIEEGGSLFWFHHREDGDYYGVDDDESGLPDCPKARENYLKDVTIA